MKLSNGHISRVISAKRFDVVFPEGSELPLYTNVEVYDEFGVLVGRGVTWKNNQSGYLWEKHPNNWVRCAGDADALREGYQVRFTNGNNRRWSWFGKQTQKILEIADKRQIPKSKPYMKELERWGELEDRNLFRILDDVLEGVVTKLGFNSAMLATYEADRNILPCHVLRVRKGQEWILELGEDLCGVHIEGFTLNMDEQPDHFVTRAINRALAGRGEGYEITHHLYDLWGHAFNNFQDDKWVVGMMQRTLNIRTWVLIPFIAQNEKGESVVVGNMFAGHRKRWIPKKEIYALQAFVSQASFAIQNARLFRLEEEQHNIAQERRAMAEERQEIAERLAEEQQTQLQLEKELRSLAEERREIAEDRARDMERMIGMAQVVTKLTHRMVNNLGLARSRLTRQISRKKPADAAFLEKIQVAVDGSLDIVREMRRPFEQAEIQPINLYAAIKDGLDEASVGQGVEINIDPAIGLLPKARADSSMVEVFRVLFNNASDAMDGVGKISVTAKHNEDQDQLIVQVADSGVGIPPEKHEEIFNLLYSTKQDSKKGAGLGLWWVRFYLRELNSTISVKSSLGAGAVFKLVLNCSAEPVHDHAHTQ